MRSERSTSAELPRREPMTGAQHGQSSHSFENSNIVRNFGQKVDSPPRARQENRPVRSDRLRYTGHHTPAWDGADPVAERQQPNRRTREAVGWAGCSGAVRSTHLHVCGLLSGSASEWRCRCPCTAEPVGEPSAALQSLSSMTRPGKPKDCQVGEVGLRVHALGVLLQGVSRQAGPPASSVTRCVAR